MLADIVATGTVLLAAVMRHRVPDFRTVAVRAKTFVSSDRTK